MELRIWFTCFSWAIGTLVFAQPQPDSLEKVLQTKPMADSVKVGLYLDLAKAYSMNAPAKMLSYAEKAVALALELGIDSLSAKALIAKSRYYRLRGAYDTALVELQSAELLAHKTRSASLLGEVNYDMGVCLMYLGFGEKAIARFNHSLEHYQSISDNASISRVKNALGVFNHQDEDYEAAIAYFKSSIATGKKASLDESQFHNAINNIGICFSELGKTDSALIYVRRAMEIRKELGIDKYLADSYTNLAFVFSDKKMFRPAMSAVIQALEIQKRLGDKLGIANSYHNLSFIDFNIKGNKSITYLHKAYALAKELDTKPLQADISHSLAIRFASFGQYDSAYFYMEEYLSLKEVLEKQKKQDEIAKAKVELKIEKLTDDFNKELATEREKSAIEEFKRNQAEQKNLYIGFALLFLIVFSVIFAYAAIRILRSNQQLERKNKEIQAQQQEIKEQSEILLQSNEEISATNEALSTSQHLLTKQNKEINDSLNYAHKIQEALFPTMAEMSEALPSLMLFFQPREKVSGDAYFFAEAGELKLIAAIDCTGHGVPGAFVSVIALSLLEQIVRLEGITQPDQILNRLHKAIRKALKQNENNNHDGMDISICAIDEQNRKLTFAGAKHHLIYFQDDELIFIKGDRMCIGGEQREKERIFSLHEMNWHPPFQFYLFTDGYQDQFGGPQNRKFSPKRFRSLLKSIHHLTPTEQHHKLEITMEEWMSPEQRQIDDILIIGVQYYD